MYPARDAREMSILLRISRELDVVGDVTVTVDNPSELLAWALVLSSPEVSAWRAGDSGHRYVQAAANHRGPPIRGLITAVLDCEQHEHFWNALGLRDLDGGARRDLTVAKLSDAWAQMPIAPSTGQSGPEKPEPPQPPAAESM